MRKKYLSALLFGALLLASAGTFTSCSDYDDDIKNLQEQIDTVVSDLESLKTKVDGLGGYVTDVKVENGKLVVTANGSTVSYDLPAGGSSEVANIEIKDGHLYVNGTDKGSVGSTVTVNEEGKLVIDGEVSDLKVGTEVIIKDASNGMYTISIDGQTIQLPMASAAINSVKVVENESTYFTNINTTSKVKDNNGGIHWGVASSDIEWKGALGNISAGDLLVGGISTIDVNVSPATFDLGSAKLTLVDTEGNEAAVTVSAISYSDAPLTAGTRAASKNGEWTLSVRPTEKATADNFVDLYTDGTNNLCYALAVDGRVVSDYTFKVDTWTQKLSNDANTTSHAIFTSNGKSIDWTKLAIGENKFEFRQIDCVDSYFSFEGTNVEKAKKYGVVANGMTLTITDAFAKSQETIELTLNMLGVSGKVTTAKYTIKGTTTTVDGAVEAAKTTYTVAYEATNNLKDIVVDFGTLITANMTNDEIEDVASVSYAIADDKASEFIVGNVSGAELYIGDEEFTPSTANNSKSFAQVTSLKLPITTAQNTAKAGSYTLVMTAKDSKGNEIKKFNLPIDITLPAFDDVFGKSTKWADNKLALTLNTETSSVVALSFVKTFEAKGFAATSGIVYEVTTKVNDEAVADNVSSNEVVTFNGNILNDNKTLATNELAVTASYSFGSEGLTISTDFATTIKSIFQDVELVFYKDNATQTVAKVGTNNTIAALTGDGTANNKYNGLALKLGEYVVPIVSSQEIDGMKLKASSNQTITAGKDVVEFDVKPTISGIEKVTAEIASGVVTISNIAVGEKATMTIKFTDNSGIITEKSIAIEKPAN